MNNNLLEEKKIYPKKISFCHSMQNRKFCMRGLSCPYYHPPVDNPKKLPCFSIRDKGYCRKGADCPFDHPFFARDRPFCYYFSNNGWCHKGDLCSFEHSKYDNSEIIINDIMKIISD